MKILVTGANGYLGQGIVKHILDNNHFVIATDYKVNNIDKRAVIKECDIFNIAKNPYDYFEEPDVLLHLAWRDGFVHYSDTHIDDLPKHFKFLKSFAESNVKKLVVMGSMHEIGFFEGSIKDDTPCNPTTQYGISKNALRELLLMLCDQYSKKYQWLRGYYIVGNSQCGSSIFSKITVAEKEGKAEFPFTKGLNQFDFLDYDEFCEQVAKTITQDTINGIINICSGRPEKLADRVERFIKENGYKIKLNYGSFPDRPYDSKAVWGDSTKIDSIMTKT